MFIAEQKKRENIAEYMLYMWQLEDILRACELDIDKVQQVLIDPTNYSTEKKEDARKWYLQLIEMMKQEGKEKEGHLDVNNIILSQLSDLHLRLLKNGVEKEYSEIYFKTLPFIVELRGKSNVKDASEIEVSFTALYGYLLLKLQKKEVSTNTATAISQISALLRHLSEKYKSLSN